MYLCDICNRYYKHRKNLKRHLKEKHVPNYEYWNCTEKDCKTRFIRREYLSKHLTKVHGIQKKIALQLALRASKGDSQSNRNYYDDISDDDTVFDLIEELGNLNESLEKEFNIDELISDGEEITMDINNNNLEKDVDSVTNSLDKKDGDGVDDHVYTSPTEDDNPEVIMISDDETNIETAVEVSNLRTKTQCVVSTFTRRISYVNGQEFLSSVKVELEVYEHFD